MKKDWENIILKTIFTLIMVLFGIFLLVACLESTTGETIRFEKKDCYDKFENKILDVECMKEVRCGIIAKNIIPKYCFGDRK